MKKRFLSFISLLTFSLSTIVIKAEEYPENQESPDTQAFLIILGISALIALIITLVLNGMMKSVHPAKYASAYEKGNLHLTKRSDVYTHTTETRVKIERPAQKDH